MAKNNFQVSVGSTTTETQLFGSVTDGTARAIEVEVDSGSSNRARVRVVFTGGNAATQSYGAGVAGDYAEIAVGSSKTFIAPRGSAIIAVYAVSTSGTASVNTRLLGA
jgi:hypothetical protein